MKKRYASGGLTQADRDAGLTEEDVAAGLRGGRNERISDEDRARAMRNAARDGESIVDRYRDYSKNPEAEAIPVDMGSRAAPRSAPRPAPAAPAAPSRAVMREPMPNEIPSMPEPTTRRAAPRRGSYDRPGPIGDLMELLRGRTGQRLYRGQAQPDEVIGAKRGGSVNKMVKKKSNASSASKRGDGIASRGKTKGRMC
jgi:hypothetical protein